MKDLTYVIFTECCRINTKFFITQSKTHDPLHNKLCAPVGNKSGLLLIRPLGTNFSENGVKIRNIWFVKMHLKVSSTKCKWREKGGNDPKRILNSILAKSHSLIVIAQWSNDFMPVWTKPGSITPWNSKFFHRFVIYGCGLWVQR